MIGTIRVAGISMAMVSVVFLSGCAFGTRQPTLIYPPAVESGEKAVAHAAVMPSPKTVQIVLKPFTDQRSDKKVVGTVRNALGMRTADVIPTNSVSDWVTQALGAELRNNGYTVISELPTGTLPGSSAVVSGEILNVFCDMYFSCTGQVSLVAKVNRDGKEVLKNTMLAKARQGWLWR